MFINVFHVHIQIHLETECFHNYVILTFGNSYNYWFFFLINGSVFSCEVFWKLTELFGLLIPLYVLSFNIA